MDYKKVLSSMAEVVEDLHKSGVILHPVDLTDDTVLIGKGAALDSLSFVALVADLEERISSKADVEIEIALDKLDDFNVESPFISAHMLATYIANLVAKNV